MGFIKHFNDEMPSVVDPDNYNYYWGDDVMTTGKAIHFDGSQYNCFINDKQINSYYMLEEARMFLQNHTTKDVE